MTTEEKSKELGQKYFPNEHNIWARPNYEAQYVESACLEMAEWKDKQFAEEKKEWIEKACHVLANILVGGVHPQGIQGFIKQFQQAMEE